MKVLLVYPRSPDTFWSFKHVLRFVAKRAAFPPLGLLTVAAMLPADWGLKLVDTNVVPLADRDIAWADWVMLRTGSGLAFCLTIRVRGQVLPFA